MTAGEKLLWARLRRLGLNMRRQAPIGPYVADFAQHTAKLVVEIDGYFHSLPDNQLGDAERDAWLAANGYLVLRFSDRRVSNDLDALTSEVQAAIHARLPAGASRPSPPSPALPPSRGKGEEDDPLASWRAP